jgi:hypothetical protein
VITRRRSIRLAAVSVGLLTVVSGLTGADASGPLNPRFISAETPRAQSPEDIYAMAGGCYELSVDGEGVGRAGDGFALADPSEPLTFQATDLGTYLLYATADDFVALSEGLLGQAAYTVTDSQPGQQAGGIVLEQTDAAADAIARSAANDAAGRGDSVIAAAQPSELSEWSVSQDGGFTFTNEATGLSLGVSETGTLVAASEPASFDLTLTTGCLSYPEIEINIDGPIVGGEHSIQEVRGFMDLHLHMMAYEFLGGRARCGRPWHRYGVKYALVDCPDHAPGGEGAILEQVLSGPGPHDTDGWPTFTGWPRYNSLTHEQVYYKWMERAWRGGLRMFVNLLVDNNQLCKIYPYKRNSCNEMDGVRLQAQRIRELERYIDAQSGGPGEGWFRIVADPFEARRVINEGKLAVILGIEVSVPLDCGLLLDIPACDPEQVEERLDEVYELGVRQMEITNKFDNAFTGVAGDAGTTGIIVNQGNKGETGHYWRMETCTEDDGHAHDRRQMNFSDDAGSKSITGRDALAGGILALFGKSGAGPLYPEGPHCNILALSPLGETMIRGMVERGMIFDPDHMSARGATAALDLVEELGHSGVVSSHGWANDSIYERIYALGGVVTPYAGGSNGFVNNWRKHRDWADQRFYFGFGYGADTNGFGSQGGPRGVDAQNAVTYPFTGFGGVTVKQQVSGTKAYDINTSGVAHYGLYPDWIEDLRRIAGQDIIDDMVRGPEAYLQMWERSIGIGGDACRADVEDITDALAAELSTGMSLEEVYRTLGQPNSRTGLDHGFCMSGGRTLTVHFDPAGTLASTSIA